MFAQVVVTDRGSSRIAFFERRVNYSHYILRCGIFVLLHFLVGIDWLGIQEPSVEKIKKWSYELQIVGRRKKYGLYKFHALRTDVPFEEGGDWGGVG